MDPILSLQIDDGKTLDFVAGEDRTFTLTLYNADAVTPINLTGASVAVSLPRSGGGKTERNTAGPVFLPAAVVLASGFVSLTDHGLEQGDPVTIAASGGGAALPSPLAAITTYYVTFVDVNTFGFQDVNGTAIPLTSVGVGTFTLTGAGSPVDIAIASPATAGQATLSLRAAVSANISPGQSQDFQFSFTISGKTRILDLVRALNVTPQPVP